MSKVVTVDQSRRSFKAGADLSAKQFYIVKVNGTTDESIIAATDATTGIHLGVLQNAPKSGDTASVLLRNANGTGKVVVGTGGCAIGDALTSGATTDAGKAIVTTTGNDQVLGFALHAASAGDIVEFVPAGFVRVR
jgi:hypothetical protein